MKSIADIKEDYQMFIDIQMSKYFKFTNKSAFDNKHEANVILKIILDVYNNKIATDHLRLDNLKHDAKIAWFNNVDINFQDINLDREEAAGLSFSKNINSITDNSAISEESIPDNLDEFINLFDEQFDFLPEGALPILIYGLPLLEAYGYPFERFKQILWCEKKPKNFEKDLFSWTFDTTLAIIDSVIGKNKEEREIAYLEALEIAEDFLEGDEVEQVVNEIKNTYQKDFLKEEGNLTAKKKKKRNNHKK